MEKTILSISGKPGLYVLLSRGRSTLIVESLDEQKKRMSVGLRDKVTSLNDISMYTDDDDVLLSSVFDNVFKFNEGKKVDIDPKKASKEDLAKFMAKVLPQYDRDRVYPNDIRKIISWYNILVENGITDFSTSDEGAEEAAAEPQTEA